MQTFDLLLMSDAWTEVLQGSDFLAFDVLEATTVEVYFSETATLPADSAKGNQIASWPNDWDFEMSGLIAGTQRIWLRGNATIRGVR